MNANSTGSFDDSGFGLISKKARDSRREANSASRVSKGIIEDKDLSQISQSYTEDLLPSNNSNQSFGKRVSTHNK